LKYRSERSILTVVGPIRVERKYYRCAGCGQGVVPLDDWAGMQKGSLTIGARRLACLAASTWSFDNSSEQLREFCGLSISDQTIRRVADEEGRRAAQWMDTAPAATAAFEQAAGHTEFSGDGTMVNTREGWKEIRVTVLSKRRPGVGQEPRGWEDLQHRDLPRPGARLVSARFADSEEVGQAWRAQAMRLGLDRAGGAVSVVCDGARWIWKQVERALPGAEQVVDIYHVSEHVHRCASVLLGEGTPDARAWGRERLMGLVRHGPAELLRVLEGERARWEYRSEAAQRALTSLTGYIAENQMRMNYADRLRRGLIIGSGQIEGACKTVIGRRLKLNSARWIPQRAQNLVALPSLHYSQLWTSYWTYRAA
jgi:hypothetical protein